MQKDKVKRRKIIIIIKERRILASWKCEGINNSDSVYLRFDK